VTNTTICYKHLTLNFAYKNDDDNDKCPCVHWIRITNRLLGSLLSCSFISYFMLAESLSDETLSKTPCKRSRSSLTRRDEGS
jgi:hypothetical protein